MPHADFVHLRVHTAYSLSEGAIKVAYLARLCTEADMAAVAITDTGNLFGALEFSMACAEAGVQPIIGCQISVTRSDGQARNGCGPAVTPPPDPLVLLVQDATGYANLIKLVSKSFLDTDKGDAPQIGLDDLAARSDGLIALTGGPAGPVGRPLAEGQDEAGEAVLARLAEIFPGRLYVELMRHGLDAEDRIEPALIDLATKHDLPLVATNEAFFATPDMYDAHDALLCIADGAYLSQDERRRATREHYFKSAQDMRAAFADVPEAIDNTLVIARRCAFLVETREPLLPSVPGIVDEERALRDQARAGLDVRLHEHPVEAATPYLERLGYELDMIVKMGFAGYFLIVAEFIKWAKDNDIPVGPGRGSGAGSLVAWALSITDLDPLRFGLLFERFLNPERVSMPDFDIDFCQDRRDEVIRHVQEEYGRDRVAQIITFGKLQARAVLRDVGRVSQMPYGQVDRLCKMVPNNPADPVTLQQAIDGEPRLREERDKDPTVARLLDIALKLEGLYRHASTHAAGVVIGDRPLDELVALYRDPRSDMPVTQFNMKYVEQAGLVKFDFLGLKTLTVLERALALIAARGETVNLAALPLDDPSVYEMLGRGDTVGVFQMESSGMRDVLRKLKADRFEDLIAVVALFRPGPMDNIPSYIARKHGQELADYLHPSLEGILKETYGVIIYQEQVMQIAQVLSGFSLGKADLLRRAMGKKNKAAMAAERKSFIDGAVERDVTQATATLIFEQVDKFAGYGFNKSHAAAYALVAYQTAYLKVKYPVEFMAALMTLDQGNTDKLNLFRQELDRLGVALRQPDINRSDVDFSVEYDAADAPGAIRYALAAVKNVGAGAMRTVVAERAANGPFKDLFDFARRIEAGAVNKRQLENLARAGAFDPLDPNRAQVLAATELLLRYANTAAEERGSGQVSLFGGDTGPAQTPPLPVTAEWTMFEQLQNEFDALGFFLSAHPLDAYGTSLEKLHVVPFASVAAGNGNGGGNGNGADRVKLAGIVLGRQERNSKRGRFAFVQMSDQTGVFELTVFSELLSQCRELLEVGQALLVEAAVQRDDDQVRLTAQRLHRLDERASLATSGLTIFVSDSIVVPSLKSVIERERDGGGRVNLVVPLDDGGEARIALKQRYTVSPAMRAALKAVPGIIDVRDL
jgi:DNA polymerase-3 subunit alpha